MGKTVMCCNLSYQEPHLFNRSNIMWQDDEERKQMPKVSRHHIVKEKLKEVYNTINEQQRNFRRQVEAHNDFMFGAPEPNNG